MTPEQLSLSSDGILSPKISSQLLSYIKDESNRWATVLFSTKEPILIHPDFLPVPLLILPKTNSSAELSTYLFLEKIYPLQKKKKTYKTIYKALEITTAKIFALQILDLTHETGGIHGTHEIEMLKTWSDSPNLVETLQIYPLTEKKKQAFLIQHYYSLGNLANYKQNHTLTEKEVLIILSNILSALILFHEKGWIHNDLQLKNILLEKKSNQLKATLSDLGKMTHSDNPKWIKWIPYRVYYPPEYLLFSKNISSKTATSLLNEKTKPTISSKADIWSLGYCSYLLHYRRTPNWELFSDDWDRYQSMINPKNHQEPKEKNSLSHLIWNMLHPDPSERISAKEALDCVKQLILLT